MLDAIIAIAAGGAGGVPALIENALAKSIPVLIALLGVGGLADKVKSVFQAVARPVMKVVDWVVDKISGAARKLCQPPGPCQRSLAHGALLSNSLDAMVNKTFDRWSDGGIGWMTPR